MSATEQKLRYAIRHIARDGPLAALRTKRLIEGERRLFSDAWLDTALHRTLTAASQRLPAYRGISPPKAKLPAFLAAEVPIVNKDIIRSAVEAYYPKKGDASWYWTVGRTSGTSGAPFEIFRSPDSIIWEQSFLRQHWNWAGAPGGVWHAVLRGDLIVPINQTEPPYWLSDHIGRALYLSSRHLNERTVEEVCRIIDGANVRLLRAYPSTALLLARLVRENGLSLKIQSVQTSSEILYPAHREIIQATFGAKIFDFYGMAERVAFGMECEYGSLHINPYYSHVEVVNGDGTPTSCIGRIVGTTLHNMAMPLIRYQLGDQGQWMRNACACGRTYPILRLIGGKIEDNVFDLDGRVISPSLITFAFKGIEGIKESQVAQVSLDKWLIRVVPDDAYHDGMRVKLLENIERLVSGRLNVDVELCDSIPRLASGKFKWISQESANRG